MHIWNCELVQTTCWILVESKISYLALVSLLENQLLPQTDVRNIFVTLVNLYGMTFVTPLLHCRERREEDLEYFLETSSAYGTLSNKIEERLRFLDELKTNDSLILK